MPEHRFAYAILETALVIRHRLKEGDKEPVRMRIRHLRSAGFPERGRGVGKALDYDADGLMQLLLAHDLMAYGAAPTWAARTVRTGWATTREAIVRAAAGEDLNLLLQPSAVNDTLGVANDIDADVSAAFTPIGIDATADLTLGRSRWRSATVIKCDPLLADLGEALRCHGRKVEELIGRLRLRSGSAGTDIKSEMASINQPRKEHST